MRSNRNTALSTAAALTGFAANSLLCRTALGARAIDAWSFTCVRLGSGAVMLFLLVRIARRGREAGANVGASASVSSGSPGSWGSALALYAYAALFSLAYLRLSTGVGALVLFASVQTTMIGWGVYRGERPTRAEWVGVAIALAGLVLLTLPGAVAPDPLGLVFMLLAGAAWGAYSLRGRGSRAPLAATAGNFARSVPLALAALALNLPAAHVGARGVWLALASGALASGVGYSLWYRALPGLSPARAAVVQLVVPVLAATAGILLLGEQPTLRLVGAGAMILGGVAIAVSLRGRGTRVGAAR